MKKIAVIKPLIRQHAEDAAFLWFQRHHRIDGAEFDATDIGRLDCRIRANLAGLAAAGLSGWDLAKAQFEEFPEAGEAFVLLTVALGSGDADLVAEALALAEAGEDVALTGLSGAVGWAAAKDLKPYVGTWLKADDPRLRYLGVVALSHHRIDPRDGLGDLTDDKDDMVSARAVRLVGELGRQDLASVLIARLTDGADTIRFWAAWSLAVLGRTRDADPALKALVEAADDLREEALFTYMVTNGQAVDRPWLTSLLERPELAPTVLAASGLLRDDSLLAWILRKMDDPDMAHAAGLAFRDMLDIDFNDTDVFTDSPDPLPEPFADRDDGPWPISDRAKACLEAVRSGNTAGSFTSMRRQKALAMARAASSPGAPLQIWRAVRSFPAWS